MEKRNPPSPSRTGHADRLAKWMFVVSTVMTLGDGLVALFRADYLTGTLGVAAALASAAGAISADRALKIREDEAGQP